MDSQFDPPWIEIGPEVTGERCATVADLVVTAREQKVASRDPRDCNWNLGCDCYAWELDALHSAAEGEHADWLHMETPRGVLDLEFRIGGPEGIRAKLYRSDAPGQPERTLAQAYDELQVIQGELGVDAPAIDAVLRFAVETDAAGLATSVKLVRLTPEGRCVYVWPVWTRDATVVGIDDAPLPEGREFDDPEVPLHEDEEEGNQDEASQEGA